MPKREIIVRLEDIRSVIKEVEEMLLSIETFAVFSGSKVFSRAFERAFEIIGEALYQIRKERPDVAISDLDKIIALRHIIVHDYYQVSLNRIWSVATKNLLTLKNEIELLIEQENLKIFGSSNPDIEE